MVSTVINTLALAASAAALTTSAAGTQNGCYWTVPSAGTYNTHFSADFSSSSSLPSDLSTSIYTVNAGTSPLARRFDLTNMGYSNSNGALTLSVPGGQTVGPISSSQLVTSYSDILYGSVRTVAMISSTAGTTHGFSFYANDTQEIDFAFLTSDTTKVHLTNEPLNADASPSTVTFTAPSDATTKFHEYRVDWNPTNSMFYIDGVLVATLKDNVPSTAGFWLWNNWSNGNAWAAGPPTKNSVLQIQSIDAYLNRTTIASNIASGAQVCKVSSSSVASSSTKASSTSASSSAAVVSTAAAVVTSAASSSAAKATTTSVPSSSSSTKATSTTSAAASGATAGAVCGGIFGTSQTCASGLTCTESSMFYYYCQADSSAKVASKAKSS